MSTMAIHGGYPIEDPQQHQHQQPPPHHQQHLPPPPLLYGPISQQPLNAPYNPVSGPSHHHHHQPPHSHPHHSHGHSHHSSYHNTGNQPHHSHHSHHHTQQPQHVGLPQPTYAPPNGAPSLGLTNDRVKAMRPSQNAPGGYGQRDSSEPESVNMNGSSSSRKDKKKRSNNPSSLSHTSMGEKEKDKARLHRQYLEQRDACTAIAQALQSTPQSDHGYVLRLYPVSLERSGWLSAIEIEESWAVDSAKHTWEEEKLKIEEEYKRGKERARERLLEGIEERRKKAREEKDSDGVLADAPTFEPQAPIRPVKRVFKPAPFMLAASHPFGAAGEEMVSPFPLPLTAFTGSGGWVNGKRRQKGVGQTGGVTLGKSIGNLGGLKESEIEYDMSEIKKGVKRKRARVH